MNAKYHQKFRTVPKMEGFRVALFTAVLGGGVKPLT